MQGYVYLYIAAMSVTCTEESGFIYKKFYITHTHNSGLSLKNREHGHERKR